VLVIIIRYKPNLYFIIKLSYLSSFPYFCKIYVVPETVRCNKYSDGQT